MPGMPPPMPGMMMRAAPAKPKKPNEKPSVPLKGMFWTSIKDNKIDDTIWKDLSDEKVEIDIEDLEKRFAKKKSKALGGKKAGGGEGAKAKKQANLLDGKRQQNGGIAIAKLRIKCEDLKSVIYAMDDSVLTLDKVDILMRLAPTAEEIALLQSYEGDVNLLGKVDRFVLELTSIPHFKNRMKALKIMHTFEERKEEQDTSLQLAIEATEEVSRSTSFKRFLEYILKTGNHMNGGTRRGGSYGFKLDALKKLPTIKSTDNKSTILDWIVGQVLGHEEEVLSMLTGGGAKQGSRGELASTSDASKMSLNQITADISVLIRDVKLVKGEIEFCDTEVTEDQFVEKLSPFMEEADEAVKEMKERSDKLKDDFEKLVKSFGLTSSQCGFEDFMGILSSFIEQIVKSRKKIENQKGR